MDSDSSESDYYSDEESKIRIREIQARAAAERPELITKGYEMLRQRYRTEMGLVDPTMTQKLEVYNRFYNMKHDMLMDCSATNISCMDLSPNKEYLLCGGLNGSWSILRVPTEQHREVYRMEVDVTWEWHSKTVSSVQWYPEDSEMFTTCGKDGKLAVWHSSDLSVPVETFGDDSCKIIKHDANNVEASLLAGIAKYSDCVHLYDMKTGFRVQELRIRSSNFGHQLSEVQWHPTLKHTIAVGCKSGSVAEYDTRYHKSPLARYVPPGYTDASPCDGLFKAHIGSVNAIRYSPYGLKILSFGEDGKLNIYNTTSSSSVSTQATGCYFAGPKQGFRQECRSFCVFGESPTVAVIPLNRGLDIVNMDSCKRVTKLKSLDKIDHFVYDDTYSQGFSGGYELHRWSSDSVWQEADRTAALGLGGRDFGTEGSLIDIQAMENSTNI